MPVENKKYIESQKILSKLYSINSFSELEKIDLYKKYLCKLRSAAYSGYPEAQYELGLQYENIYFFGNNPDFSKKKCIYWYRKACEGNVHDACNNWAVYLEKDIKNEKEFNDVINLYKKAILLGNDLAKRNLKKLKKMQFVK